MTYKPDYAIGQVIVVFKPDLKVDIEEYAKGYANALGYNVLLEENKEDIIFKTRPGEEEKAVARLSKKPQIDTAYRRDLRYERRARMQEKIADEAETLFDILEERESTYQGQLEKILGLCKKAKKL
jgi:hypothetical protein